LGGIYFIVAIDGTGTIRFRRRHCPHCLTRTRNGKILYYPLILHCWYCRSFIEKMLGIW